MEKAARKTINILLADDDADDHEFFDAALAELDKPVELKIVKNGNELINALSSPDAILPDIIFLDLNMPQKDGSECLAEIKSDPRLNHIAIIIYSTSSRSEQVDAGYAAGANLYVIKPDTFAHLKTILNHVINMDWSTFIPQPSRDRFLLQLQ
jgi:CheY-like chemotaxis protein